MFNGIIDSIGVIKNIEKTASLMRLVVRGPVHYENLTIGESVALNGVCLTIEDQANSLFEVAIVPETLQLTNLSELQIDQFVNLERSLSVASRISGHMVQGHVDDVGEIVAIHLEGESALRVKIQPPAALMPLIVNKGFIAIDGMSITIAKRDATDFEVTFIPHTQKSTIIPHYAIGTKVNLEVDILGKYVLNQLELMQHAISDRTR